MGNRWAAANASERLQQARTRMAPALDPVASTSPNATTAADAPGGGRGGPVAPPLPANVVLDFERNGLEARMGVAVDALCLLDLLPDTQLSLKGQMRTLMDTLATLCTARHICSDFLLHISTAFCWLQQVVNSEKVCASLVRVSRHSAAAAAALMRSFTCSVPGVAAALVKSLLPGLERAELRMASTWCVSTLAQLGTSIAEEVRSQVLATRQQAALVQQLTADVLHDEAELLLSLPARPDNAAWRAYAPTLSQCPRFRAGLTNQLCRALRQCGAAGDAVLPLQAYALLAVGKHAIGGPSGQEGTEVCAALKAGALVADVKPACVPLLCAVLARLLHSRVVTPGQCADMLMAVGARTDEGPQGAPRAQADAGDWGVEAGDWGVETPRPRPRGYRSTGSLALALSVCQQDSDAQAAALQLQLAGRFGVPTDVDAGGVRALAEAARAGGLGGLGGLVASLPMLLQQEVAGTERPSEQRDDCSSALMALGLQVVQRVLDCPSEVRPPVATWLLQRTRAATRPLSAPLLDTIQRSASVLIGRCLGGWEPGPRQCAEGVECGRLLCALEAQAQEAVSGIAQGRMTAPLAILFIGAALSAAQQADHCQEDVSDWLEVAMRLPGRQAVAALEKLLDEEDAAAAAAQSSPHPNGCSSSRGPREKAPLSAGLALGTPASGDATHLLLKELQQVVALYVPPRPDQAGPNAFWAPAPAHHLPLATLRLLGPAEAAASMLPAAPVAHANDWAPGATASPAPPRPVRPAAEGAHAGPPAPSVLNEGQARSGAEAEGVAGAPRESSTRENDDGADGPVHTPGTPPRKRVRVLPTDDLAMLSSLAAMASTLTALWSRPAALVRCAEAASHALRHPGARSGPPHTHPWAQQGSQPHRHNRLRPPQEAVGLMVASLLSHAASGVTQAACALWERLPHGDAVGLLPLMSWRLSQPVGHGGPVLASPCGGSTPHTGCPVPDVSVFRQLLAALPRTWEVLTAPAAFVTQLHETVWLRPATASSALWTLRFLLAGYVTVLRCVHTLCTRADGGGGGGTPRAAATADGCEDGAESGCVQAAQNASAPVGAMHSFLRLSYHTQCRAILVALLSVVDSLPSCSCPNWDDAPSAPCPPSPAALCAASSCPMRRSAEQARVMAAIAASVEELVTDDTALAAVLRRLPLSPGCVLRLGPLALGVRGAVDERLEHGGEVRGPWDVAVLAAALQLRARVRAAAGDTQLEGTGAELTPAWVGGLLRSIGGRLHIALEPSCFAAFLDLMKGFVFMYPAVFGQVDLVLRNACRWLQEAHTVQWGGGRLWGSATVGQQLEELQNLQALLKGHVMQC